MDNQHRKISGYRELTRAEIDLMNEIKALGPQIDAVLEKCRAHIDEQYEARRGTSNQETKRLAAAEPGRWLSIAKTELQQGLMAATRAIAQPTFF